MNPRSLPLTITQMTPLTTFSYVGHHIQNSICQALETVSDSPTLRRFGFRFHHPGEPDTIINPPVRGKTIPLSVRLKIEFSRAYYLFTLLSLGKTFAFYSFCHDIINHWMSLFVGTLFSILQRTNTESLSGVAKLPSLRRSLERSTN